MELEKTLALRMFTAGPDGKIPHLDNLKEFTGTNIVVRFLPDIECQRAAMRLMNALLNKDIGWTMEKGALPDPSMWTPFFDGVVVTWWDRSFKAFQSLPPQTPQNEPARMAKLRELLQESRRSARAADELVDFLEINGWKARSVPDLENNLPRDSIGIAVGFRPSPYFDPKEIKEMNEKLEKMRQQMMEERRREDSIFPPVAPK
jgi:hypothetical protein